MPEGFVVQVLLLEDNRESGVGDDVFGIRAENAAKQFPRAFEIAALQARLRHLPVRIHVFGIITQNVLAEREGLIAALVLDECADFFRVCA